MKTRSNHMKTRSFLHGNAQREQAPPSPAAVVVAAAAAAVPLAVAGCADAGSGPQPQPPNHPSRPFRIPKIEKQHPDTRK